MKLACSKRSNRIRKTPMAWPRLPRVPVVSDLVRPVARSAAHMAIPAHKAPVKTWAKAPLRPKAKSESRPPLMMSPELPPSPEASDQLEGAGNVEKAPQARKVAESQASIAMNGRSGL